MSMRTLQCTHKIQELELVEVSGETLLTEEIGAVSKVTGEISQASEAGEISRETIFNHKIRETIFSHQIKGLIPAITGDKVNQGEIIITTLDTNPVSLGEITIILETNLVNPGEISEITGVKPCFTRFRHQDKGIIRVWFVNKQVTTT